MKNHRSPHVDQTLASFYKVLKERTSEVRFSIHVVVGRQDGEKERSKCPIMILILIFILSFFPPF